MARTLNGSKQVNAVYRLRPDLKLTHWDDVPDGKPRWLVHDPVANSLDTVAWPECVLLLELQKGASVETLVETVSSGTTLQPSHEDVFDYVRRLAAKGWVRGTLFPSRAAATGNTGIFSFSWWFSRYLYCRIDLWNPDSFLEKTLPLARLLASWPVLLALAFSAVLGLYLSLPRWEEFGLDLVRVSVWSRLTWIVPAIVVVKLIHEFAHAYVAKSAGARVDSMGVALVLLFPLPFARVTDAWRLPCRLRFAVAAAGMLAEIALACLALPVWAMAPPGLGKDLCQMVASTALLSTLLVNLNPGARFDGYFMLSHLLRVENLRAKSAACLTRLWRALFWGVDCPDPVPEHRLTGRAWLTLYAAYAWCYRLILYFGMALLAYARLPKALGIAMLAAMAVVFFVKPFLAETRQLWRIRAKMNWRAGITLFLLLGLTAWFVMELPRRTSFPAVARAGSEIAVSVPRAGQLIESYGEEDMAAAPGRLLARVRSGEIEAELGRMSWAAEEAKRAAEHSLLSDKYREQLIARTAVATARGEASRAMETRISLNDLRASTAGVIAEWESWVRPGVFVPRGAVLGWMVRHEKPMAVGLVDIAVAGRLRPGTRAKFLPDDNSGSISGILVTVERNRLESVTDGALATGASGRFDGRVWQLERPMLRVVVRLDRPHPRTGQSGRVWLSTEPYSLAADAWNWVRALAVRESGF